jgi:hypothetical protein
LYFGKNRELGGKWRTHQIFFITTSVKTIGLTALADVPIPPTVGSLDGTITQFVEEHLLASTKY